MKPPGHAHPPPSEPDEIRGFARARLGPGCEDRVIRVDVRGRIEERRRAGADLEDAVLAEIHSEAPADQVIANEFIAYFIVDLMRLGRSNVSPNLRAQVDSADLVQSVLGDVWPTVWDIEYRTRGQFLAYLAQRLRWKAIKQYRTLSTIGRLIEKAADELAAEPPPPSPMTELLAKEGREQLALILVRLGERDRELVIRSMRGESVEHIAAALGMSKAATYKAMQRAVERAKRSKP